MCQTGKLFRSSLSGNDLWTMYLNAFESDPIFRDPESSKHNCNHCKNFIRRYGNIVSINSDLTISSIFDVIAEGEYRNVAKTLSEILHSKAISEVFVETFDVLNSLPYESVKKGQNSFKLGVLQNVKRYTKEEAEKFGVVKPNELKTFNHLALTIPASFISITSKSVESISADFRDAKNVFSRAMDEISIDTLELVIDLIKQGSLLNAESQLDKIAKILEFKTTYSFVPFELKDNWCWLNSYQLPIAKFRNELIGVLCVELSEGMELNKACENWNKRVDPINYKKAIAPVTERQKNEARKFIENEGYEESFDRRFATLDDIKVSEILHINSGNGEIKKVSIFDNVKATSTQHKRATYDNVQEVSIETFMKDILPGCTSVEALLLNKHEKNMVTLTTANVKESKPIFPWSNNYSWTYNGNLTGKSQIAEAVKSVGGVTDAILRFSITWNEDGRDICDLDAHCITPNNSHIYYGNYRMPNKTKCGGCLDIDMIRPSSLGVENIFWLEEPKLNGKYEFLVNNYDGRPNKGFKAEIVYKDQIFTYIYNKPLFGKIKVADILLKNNDLESINHNIEYNTNITVNKEIYGLESNNFHKVNLVCLSPNYWDDNKVGNKHYFFMLEGAKTLEDTRSFHNENLLPSFRDHRKTMEILANATKLSPTDKQLCGLGFNATVRDEVILRLSGTHKRMIKVKF